MVAGGIGLAVYDKEVLFRLFNTNHNPLLDSLMPFGTLLGQGITISIIMLALLALPAFQNWWYVVAAVACNVLPTLAAQAIKSIVNADRPLQYFNKADWIHILPDWKELYHHSFPSGHTCGAFAMFCLLSCILSRRYKPFGILFFLLALMVGYSRVYLSAHFFADVYVGSLIGVLFSVFILSLLRRNASKFFNDQKEVV
jgi:membrane-associated phospholipid phosphatase